MCNKDSQEKDTFLDLDQATLGKDVKFPSWIDENWKDEKCLKINSSLPEICNLKGYLLMNINDKEKFYYKENENVYRFAQKIKFNAFDPNDDWFSESFKDCYKYFEIKKIDEHTILCRFLIFNIKEKSCFDYRGYKIDCETIEWTTFTYINE